MAVDQLISGKEFCSHHHIEVHFLHSLHEFGLIDLTHEEDDFLLHPEQLMNIEKMIRLHYDLHVNFEGIDVINNLLQQLEDMQARITALQNKMRQYDAS